MKPTTGQCRRNPLRRARRHGMICHMHRRPTTEAPADRHLIVRERDLSDLLALSMSALDRMPESDPLHRELRGVIAQVRSSTIPEP